MKIAIESTATLTQLDGAPVRVWEGVTEAGVPCKVFVARIAVHKSHDQAAFERELHETAAPGEIEAPRSIPLRSIL